MPFVLGTASSNSLIQPNRRRRKGTCPLCIHTIYITLKPKLNLVTLIDVLGSRPYHLYLDKPTLRVIVSVGSTTLRVIVSKYLS